MSTFKQQQGASNREWGAFAESKARDYLICQGYTVREFNVRFNHIEIDIIAQKGDMISFVEVKARQSHDSALEAVDGEKQRLMIAAADMYLRQLDQLYFYSFDIITVTGTEEKYEIRHYPDAFMPPLRTKLHVPRPRRLKSDKPSHSGYKEKIEESSHKEGEHDSGGHGHVE